MRIENKTGLKINGENKNGEKNKMKMRKQSTYILGIKYKINSYSCNYVDNYQQSSLNFLHQWICKCYWRLKYLFINCSLLILVTRSCVLKNHLLDLNKLQKGNNVVQESFEFSFKNNTVNYVSRLIQKSIERGVIVIVDDPS